jgi:hypothetical protein
MNNIEAMKQLVAGFKIRRAKWHDRSDYIKLDSFGVVVNSYHTPCGNNFDMHYDDWEIYSGVHKPVKKRVTYYRRKWLITNFNDALLTSTAYYTSKEQFDRQYMPNGKVASDEWEEYTIELLDLGDGE